MNTITNTNIENLKWVNENDGATFHAGVAFYQPRFGEYKLILDAPKTVLYLKPTESNNDEIKYKVFSPVFKLGKFSHKVEVGYGYSSNETDGQIYVTVGRYYPNRLALVPKKEKLTLVTKKVTTENQ